MSATRALRARRRLAPVRRRDRLTDRQTWLPITMGGKWMRILLAALWPHADAILGRIVTRTIRRRRRELTRPVQARNGSGLQPRSPIPFVRRTLRPHVPFAPGG